MFICNVWWFLEYGIERRYGSSLISFLSGVDGIKSLGRLSKFEFLESSSRERESRIDRGVWRVVEGFLGVFREYCVV